jgi:acetyl esterase/lipase
MIKEYSSIGDAMGTNRRNQFRWAVSMLAVVVALTVPACGTPDPTTSGSPTQPRLLQGVPYGSLPAQTLDLHLPGGSGPYPVLVYLHSGGWTTGDRQYVPDFLLDQVARGFALVSVDYRLAGVTADGTRVDDFPTPNEDVDRAIRFVRAHADDWSLDPNRIIVAGASAGGHLALLAATAPGAFVAADLPPTLQAVSPVVQGVMAFVAPSDLTKMTGEDNEIAQHSLAAYLGCSTGAALSCDPERARAASPTTYLGAGAPPAYLAYGLDDTLVPAATQGVPLALQWAAARGETLGAPGATVVLELAHAGHNLDLSNFDHTTMEAWLDAVTGAPRG